MLYCGLERHCVDFFFFSSCQADVLALSICVRFLSSSKRLLGQRMRSYFTSKEQKSIPYRRTTHRHRQRNTNLWNMLQLRCLVRTISISKCSAPRVHWRTYLAPLRQIPEVSLHRPAVRVVVNGGVQGLQGFDEMARKAAFLEE